MAGRHLLIRIMSVGVATIALGGCSVFSYPKEEAEQRQNIARAKKLTSSPAGFTRTGIYPECSINLDCTRTTVNVGFTAGQQSAANACRSVLQWAIDVGQAFYYEAATEDALGPRGSADFTIPLNAGTRDALATRCARRIDSDINQPTSLNLTGTRIPSTDLDKPGAPTYVHTSLSHTREPVTPGDSPWGFTVSFAR